MADYTIVEHVLEAKTKRAAIEKAREYNERYAQEARKIFLPIQVHFLLETVRSETKGCRGRYKFNRRLDVCSRN